jgi:hypothetical protein
VLGFCPITLLTMHYSVSEGPRFESSMWKKKKIFLDIKKFLYTHEKDEFNDVKTHIFEKMY